MNVECGSQFFAPVHVERVVEEEKFVRTSSRGWNSFKLDAAFDDYLDDA